MVKNEEVNIYKNAWKYTNISHIIRKSKIHLQLKFKSILKMFEQNTELYTWILWFSQLSYHKIFDFKL